MRVLMLACVLCLATGMAGALASGGEPRATASAALPDMAVEFDSVEIYPGGLTYRRFRFVNVGSVAVDLTAYRWRVWNSDDELLSADVTLLFPEQQVSLPGTMLQPGESVPQSFWIPWSARPRQIVELVLAGPGAESSVQNNQLFIDVTAIFRRHLVIPGLAGDEGTNTQMEVTAAAALQAVCADADCTLVEIEVAVSYTYDGRLGSDAEIRVYARQDDACLVPDYSALPISIGSYSTTTTAVLNRIDPLGCPDTPTTVRISSLQTCFARSRLTHCQAIPAGVELAIVREP